MASLQYHFKTSTSSFISFFLVSCLLTGFMIFYRVIADLNLNRPLNYTNIGSIYESVAPMDIYYNSKVEGSNESTSDFMNIIKVSSDNAITLVSKDWPA